MEIRLSKDFLVYPSETNFPDIWEALCCKLLNLENNTTEIYRRKPPENGVDIFYQAEKIAYQCKCTDNADSKGHNLTKIEKSYHDALKIKSELNWEKYYLCLNYDLTGKQEANLKEKIPNIIIWGKSYWLQISEKFSLQVAENIRQFIPIPIETIKKSIDERFYPDYAEKLKNELNEDSYEISVYSNRTKSLYKLLVSPKFTIEYLKTILVEAWKLPRTEHFSGYDFWMEYKIIFKDTLQSDNKTLGEIGISSNDILSLNIDFEFQEANRQVSGGMLGFVTLPDLDNGKKSLKELLEKVFNEFDEKIQNLNYN